MKTYEEWRYTQLLVLLNLGTRFWASFNLHITAALPSVEAIRIGTGVMPRGGQEGVRATAP